MAAAPQPVWIDFLLKSAQYTKSWKVSLPLVRMLPKMGSMQKTVSDQVVEMLASAGVRRIYGMAGDALHPLMEALQRDARIRWVHVRHEETAAFAASAEAQLTGELAVCCGSCGPGNMHLINGLYDASRSVAPVLALAAHLPTLQIGTHHLHETHPTFFFRECVVYCELASRPRQVPPVLAEAMRSARARRGVGMLVLPGDVAAMDAVEEAAVAPVLPVAPPEQRASEPVLRRMAVLLNGASRITFLCGIGSTGAEKEIVALAKRLQAPVAYTLRAKDLFEKENPNAVGMSGLLGWGGAVHALLDCDVLVMWGTDFPYSDFLPRQGRVIQVDTDAAALGRRVPLALGVQADVGEVARALLPIVNPNRSDEFLRSVRTYHAREVAAISQPLRVVDEDAPLRPELLTRLVSDHAEPDAVFTVDTGTPDIWCARYLQALGSRRILGSFNHGSMGCALAMAIGAKSVYPKRQVIALCGDGGLSMLAGDLLTLLQEGLAVKILVYNNSELDYVALEQLKAGIQNPIGTSLHTISYAAVARAMGLRAWSVSRVNEAIPAVKEWLAADGPALLDAAVDRHALPLPPGLTFMHGLGFCKSLGEQSHHMALDSIKRLLFGNRRFFT